MIALQLLKPLLTRIEELIFLTLFLLPMITPLKTYRHQLVIPSDRMELVQMVHLQPAIALTPGYAHLVLLQQLGLLFDVGSYLALELFFEEMRMLGWMIGVVGGALLLRLEFSAVEFHQLFLSLQLDMTFEDVGVGVIYLFILEFKSIFIAFIWNSRQSILPMISFLMLFFIIRMF